MNKIEQDRFYAFSGKIVLLFKLSYIINHPFLIFRIAKVTFYHTIFKKDILWNANLALISKRNTEYQHCFAILSIFR